MKPRGLDLYRINLAGGHLDARLSYPDPEPGRFAIIYLHGFGSTKTGQKAEAVELACAERDWACASFDFRGHGASSGSMLDLRPSGLIADLEAVHDDLRKRGVERVGLIGSSMGAWAAVWFTKRHPGTVVGLGLFAPAFNFPRSRRDSLTPEARQQWEETGRLRVRNEWIDVEIGRGMLEEADQFSLRDLTHGWNKPVLVYHAQDDPVVPFHESLAFVNALKTPGTTVRIIKEGGHRMNEHRMYLGNSACEYIEKYLKKK
jgi:pimeloyl-ACP methyl ester carboxylesterase